LFRHAFYNQHRQSHASLPPAQILYSASIAIHVAARVLSENNLKTGLLTPTFDNIPDLLHAQGVRPIALTEANVLDPALWDHHELGALFLVMPNNPTGWTISESQLRTLVADATSRRLLLVFDFSFRYFDPQAADAYRIFSDAQCSFIAIEDTGKYLPCADLKVGMIVSDKVTRNLVSAAVEDLLLNVSPFTLELLSQMIMRDDRQAILSIIRINRARLTQAMERLEIDVHTLLETMSVAWVSARARGQMASLMRGWAEVGISALPGNPFFWEDHSRGADFARIALARSQTAFDGAMKATTGEHHWPLPLTPPQLP
jgi:aspartate/methionine/tyrosine aminotransferase